MLDLHLAQDRYYHNMRAFLLALMVEGNLKHLALYNMRLSPRYMKDLLYVCAGRFSQSTTSSIMPSPHHYQGLVAPPVFSPEPSTSASTLLDSSDQSLRPSIENQPSLHIRSELGTDESWSTEGGNLLERDCFIQGSDEGSDTEEAVETELDLYDAALLAPSSGSSHNLVYRCNRFHARHPAGSRHGWPHTHPALHGHPNRAPKALPQFRKRTASSSLSPSRSLSDEPKRKQTKGDLEYKAAELTTSSSNEGTSCPYGQTRTSSPKSQETMSCACEPDGTTCVSDQHKSLSCSSGQEGTSSNSTQEGLPATCCQPVTHSSGVQPTVTSASYEEKSEATLQSACKAVNPLSEDIGTNDCDDTKDTCDRTDLTSVAKSPILTDSLCNPGDTTVQLEQPKVCLNTNTLLQSSEGASSTSQASSSPTSPNKASVAGPITMTEGLRTCEEKEDVASLTRIFTNRSNRDVAGDSGITLPEHSFVTDTGVSSLAVIDCNGTTLGAYLATILPTWNRLKNLTLTFTGKSAP